MTLDHQPAAQSQQQGAGQSLQYQDADLLPQHNREMSTGSSQIFPGQAIGGGGYEGGAACPFHQADVAGEFFKPCSHRIFRAGFLNRRRNGMTSHHIENEQHGHDQQQVEGQQNRVIKSQQQHADQGLQAIRQSVEQQYGGGFLDSHDIEEAIDQFRPVSPIECLQPDSLQATGDIAQQTDENAPLKHFHDIDLKGDEEIVQRQTTQQNQNQDHQRLQ